MTEPAYHLVSMDHLDHLAGPYNPYEGDDNTVDEAEKKMPSETVGDGVTSLEEKFYHPQDRLPAPLPSARHLRRQEWLPFVLRLSSLLAFIAFLLALISLAEVFRKKSPYPAPTSSGLLFAWTYLPPAIVVIIDWIWELFDLQIKLILPWSLLFRPRPGHGQPWLLDYRSINTLSAAWHAMKHSHYIVILTSLGFWISAVASVMSTSLWAIEPLTHVLPGSFIKTSTMPDVPAVTTGMWSDDTYLNFFLGHRVLNLSTPRWMTDDYNALEPFQLSSPSQSYNGTQHAVTTGYSARLDCVPANNISYGPNTSVNTFVATVDAAGCTASYSLQNPLPERLTGTFYYGFILDHSCPGDSNPVTIISTVQASNFSHFDAIALACSPLYQRQSVAVDVPSSSAEPLNTSVIANSSEAFTYSGGDSFLQFVQNNTGEELQTGWNNLLDTNYTQNTNLVYSAWFDILLLANSGLSMEDLLDLNTLQTLSQAAFSELWADFASQILFTPPSGAEAQIQGSVEVTTQVLQARVVSVRVLQAMLATMAFVALIVYIVHPRTNLPLDPSNLVSMAALLSRSDHSVREALQHTGGMSQKAFDSKMEQWSFSSGQPGEFSIRAEKKLLDPGTATHAAPHEPDLERTDLQRTRRYAWRPLMLHPVAQILLLIIIAGTIATLESLYHHSEANHGLLAAPTGLISDGWSYIAPFYIAILGLLITSYELSGRAVQPFVAMADFPQPVQRSVGYNPAAHTGISLLWHSLKNGSIMGTISACSVLVIPFMKIAIAGVFIPSMQPSTTGAQVDMIETFNTTLNASLLVAAMNDQTGAFLDGQLWSFSQVPSYSLPWPSWTTDEEAVASVNLST